MTKYKRIPIPPQYQSNGSSLLLVTRSELEAIVESILTTDYLPDGNSHLWDWAWNTQQKLKSTPPVQKS